MLGTVAYFGVLVLSHDIGRLAKDGITPLHSGEQFVR
jgi:hypothetical protein